MSLIIRFTSSLNHIYEKAYSCGHNTKSRKIVQRSLLCTPFELARVLQPRDRRRESVVAVGASTSKASSWQKDDVHTS